jgi:hypothetical protein
MLLRWQLESASSYSYSIRKKPSGFIVLSSEYQLSRRRVYAYLVISIKNILVGANVVIN